MLAFITVTVSKEHDQDDKNMIKRSICILSKAALRPVYSRLRDGNLARNPKSEAEKLGLFMIARQDFHRATVYKPAFRLLTKSLYCHYFKSDTIPLSMLFDM